MLSILLFTAQQKLMVKQKRFCLIESFVIDHLMTIVIILVTKESLNLFFIINQVTNSKLALVGYLSGKYFD